MTAHCLALKYCKYDTFTHPTRSPIGDGNAWIGCHMLSDDSIQAACERPTGLALVIVGHHICACLTALATCAAAHTARHMDIGCSLQKLRTRS